MGLLCSLFGGPSKEEIAEDYIRSECDGTYVSALIRHYAVGETSDEIERFTGARLTDQQTARVVQKLRDEYGYGPIAEHNLPGYTYASEYPEDMEDQRQYHARREERNAEIEEEQRGGLLGWLFGV